MLGGPDREAFMVYNVAIIGYGGMAHCHFERVSSHERIRFVGVYDPDPKRCELAAKEGMKVYSSEEELFADKDVNIVLVATPNDVHKEICIAAMRAGKHVICEKPVTLSSTELEEIIAVRDETGMLFTINQNRRVDVDYLLMKEQIESGIIGEPYIVESRVEGSRGMPSGWRTIKSMGGGMMLDWGVHLIDQILCMFDERVANVFCKMYNIEYSDVDDNFTLIMSFQSGLTVHIEVGTNNYIAHPRWYVRCETGTLVIDDWECTGKIVRCIDKENVWADEIVYTKAGPTKTMAPRNPRTTETIEIAAETTGHTRLAPTYDQLIDAIEGRAPLKITAEQALRVMRVMEAAFESSERGIAVNTDI